MKWTANNVEVLKSRLRRGWSTTDIATAFHISDNAVAKKAQSLGISLHGGVPLPRKGKSKIRTRAERMNERPPKKLVDDETPAPTDPSKPPTEPDPTEPVSMGELKREDGGIAFYPRR